MLMSMTKVQDFRISLLKGSLFSHLHIKDEQDIEILDLCGGEGEVCVMRPGQVHEVSAEVRDEGRLASGLPFRTDFAGSRCSDGLSLEMLCPLPRMSMHHSTET